MATLTRELLPAVIASAGRGPAAPGLYGAHDHDRIVIDQRAGGNWVVFYTERGSEFDLRHP